MNELARFINSLAVLSAAMVTAVWHPLELMIRGESDEDYYRRKYPELYVRDINDWTD